MKKGDHAETIDWEKKFKTLQTLYTEAKKAVEYKNKELETIRESEKKWSFLAKASKLLASSLDFQTTLKNVAHLAVPEIADWCMVELVDKDGTLKNPPVIVHKDPQKVALLQKMRKGYTGVREEKRAIVRAIRTGKSEVRSLTTDQLRREFAQDEEQFADIKKLGLTSWMHIPLIAEGKTIGAIGMARSGNKKIFDKADLAMVDELASRASFAVENARLHQKAKRAIAIRNDFMSIASHELRTPITSVKMYAQFLKKMFEQSSDKKFIDYFERMDEQVDKMSLLIGDLLDVSRIEHGKFEIKIGTFSLDDEIKEAVKVCQATTEKHFIRIEGEAKKKVRGDNSRISQVLINLLTNAIRYSPDADTVIVKVNPTDKGAVVAVQDFGVGIVMEEKDKLFEPFYRSVGAEKETKSSPGLGIGLYVASQIIQKHGSKIAVESEKGKGSTFSFTLSYA